jgi:hypothetical protein
MAKALGQEFNENSVRYSLYPLDSSIESLNDYISKSFIYLSKYLSQYIWNKQSFNLRLVSNDFGLYLNLIYLLINLLLIYLLIKL